MVPQTNAPVVDAYMKGTVLQRARPLPADYDRGSNTGTRRRQ